MNVSLRGHLVILLEGGVGYIDCKLARTRTTEERPQGMPVRDSLDKFAKVGKSTLNVGAPFQELREKDKDGSSCFQHRLLPNCQCAMRCSLLVQSPLPFSTAAVPSPWAELTESAFVYTLSRPRCCLCTTNNFCHSLLCPFPRTCSL